MTREEIKEELLNDEDQQFKTMVAAQFATLYEYLTKKEIFTKDDIEKMNKSIEEYVEKINNVTVDVVMERLNKEENNEYNQ